MRPRSELHAILKSIPGVGRVYHQPPESVKLEYPCIVYSRIGVDEWRADNRSYIQNRRYQVTVIDPNPDSPIPDLVNDLPMCSMDLHFTKDRLHHDVFTLYF